jgi:hypothetical protein
VPWTAAPPTNINDSFQEDVEKTDTKVELFGGYRERDLNNDDDDGPPLRSFTFSGSSPFVQELTQEEKISQAVNTAIVGISKTYNDKISTLE